LRPAQNRLRSGLGSGARSVTTSVGSRAPEGEGSGSPRASAWIRPSAPRDASATASGVTSRPHGDIAPT
jgi:hypothetical protein